MKSEIQSLFRRGTPAVRTADFAPDCHFFGCIARDGRTGVFLVTRKGVVGVKWTRLAALFCALLCLSGACALREPEQAEPVKSAPVSAASIDTTGFLRLVSENMETVDPQCTTEFYLVALNVFDRLVELKTDANGEPVIAPSLAESWEVSEDALTYRFRLREGVRFSNGSALTASDVRFTFERLLTHPKSVNAILMMSVLGAQELYDGRTDSLAGFRELDELTFEITLCEPYAAFLDWLTAPGASILDEETLYRVDNLFGIYDRATIGTGSFILKKWTIGRQMILTANPNCWAGAPRCPGVEITIQSDAESQLTLFENGELDILDLDGLGGDADYILRNREYAANIRSGQRIGISYLTLNQSIPPLNDVRVRKALQYALDRQTILDAAYNGHGHLENGIFPHGLKGFNPALDPIPYDPERARALLAEAGYPEGFALELAVSADAKQATRDIVEIVAYMWQCVGVRAEVRVMEASAYAAQRRAGRLAVCAQGWTADYDDPDNFIYTFFGSGANSLYWGLCYSDEAVMSRVRAARDIADEQARLAEYRALEQKIVQEDAAWVPLFSRVHYFAVSDRVKNFEIPWNGWSFGFYREIVVDDKNG